MKITIDVPDIDHDGKAMIAYLRAAAANANARLNDLDMDAAISDAITHAIAETVAAERLTEPSETRAVVPAIHGRINFNEPLVVGERPIHCRVAVARDQYAVSERIRLTLALAGYTFETDYYSDMIRYPDCVTFRVRKLDQPDAMPSAGQPAF